MRRNARVDANQKDIVDALYSVPGVSVQHLHAQGMGCPDILVGWRNKNYLFEIKDPAKKPSARELTKMQERWHFQWSGQVAVIHSVEDALEIIGAK